VTSRPKRHACPARRASEAECARSSEPYNNLSSPREDAEGSATRPHASRCGVGRNGGRRRSTEGSPAAVADRDPPSAVWHQPRWGHPLGCSEPRYMLFLDPKFSVAGRSQSR
jgi:hypothetical protein